MKKPLHLKPMWLSAALLLVLSSQSFAGILVNPGFEAGFTAWSRVDQLGSEGTFALQTGTSSPVTATAVPAPPGGTLAAMTDAEGPGAHVLYQDFMVPAAVSSAILSFDLFVGNRAGAFVTPNTLDFATPALNQQARVDILLGGAASFSLNPADLLMNVYQTSVGDPTVSGYTHRDVNITNLINSHVGSTLRVRFAETDNVNFFQLGVDNVDINTLDASIPEPSTLGLVAGALLAIRYARRRWSH